MVGLIFNRLPGYLSVEFSHRDSLDMVDIRFKIYGETLSTSSCDDEFKIVNQELAVAPDATLNCWTYSGSARFFLKLIRWLEAVLCEVDECALLWEGEGPDGELRWFKGHEGNGQLELTWSGSRHSQSFKHQVGLDQRQMVHALYKGFRSFVESEAYDPMSYEDLSHGQVWDLVVNDGGPAFVMQVAQYDRDFAYAMHDAVGQFTLDRFKATKHNATLEDLRQLAQKVVVELSEQPEHVMDHVEKLTPLGWNQWTVDQRVQHLQEVVGPMKGYGMFGENLRELRSPRIEDWLAQ